MINRSLRIALIVSVTLHLVAMSAVTIITPQGVERIKPFTQVDFLGPILRKTAFDIMIENITPLKKTDYSGIGNNITNSYLRADAPRIEPSLFGADAYGEMFMGPRHGWLLPENKTVPNFLLENSLYPMLPDSSALPENRTVGFSRDVVYRPEPPLLLKGLYGQQEAFAMKVRIMVDESGTVKIVEPLTTTGFPQIDIAVSKYVRKWIFAPKSGLTDGYEWIEQVVVIRAGGR